MYKRQIHNCHDYQSVLERSLAPVAFNEDTLSNVSLETLQSVLDSDAPKFISIGRFSPEKGHKRLLDAFEQYWKEHPDTWLIIIGGVGNLYDETLAHTCLLYTSQCPFFIISPVLLFLLPHGTLSVSYGSVL